MEWADLARLAAGVLALASVLECGWAIVTAAYWDQRGRFGVLIGYALIVVGAQLDSLGRPPTWRTWAALVVTLAAVVLTAVYLLRQRNGGARDDRRADDQRRVLRPGRPAGRGGRAGRGAEPPGGGAAP